MSFNPRPRHRHSHTVAQTIMSMSLPSTHVSAFVPVLCIALMCVPLTDPAGYLLIWLSLCTACVCVCVCVCVHPPPILLVSPRARPGGYTRVLKCGFRVGDRAPLAILEYVDR